MPVIGTAGHVDHGKSTLIERLTGRNPMHLPEEHARGLTIELGFGWWRSPSGLECGIVDVPGHGTFVRKMASGAFALDAVMFVVAADDGWKPQSEEHFFICRTARIPAGIVVITKADIVPPSRIAELRDELSIRFEGTFLENAALVALDPSNAGTLAELETALDSLLAGLPPARSIGKPRLWADRAFKIEGAGLVVTGTLTGDALKSGDELIVLPEGGTAKVRKLEMHGRSVESAVPNSRVAANLVIAGKTQPARGSLLAKGAPPALTNEVWAMADVAPCWQPGLRSGGNFVAHIGTRSYEARVLVHGARSLSPRERAVCRILFAKPAPVEVGDHIVIFSSSRYGVVASCEVLYVEPIERARRLDRSFAVMEAASHVSPHGYAELKIEIAPARLDTLDSGTKFSREETACAADDLMVEGKASVVSDGSSKYLIETGCLEKALAAVSESMVSALRDVPAGDVVPQSRISFGANFDAPVKRAILARFAEAKPEFVYKDGSLAKKEEVKPDFASSAEALAVLARFKGAISNYPSLKDLYAERPRERRVIARLLDEGLLVRCPDDIVVPLEMFGRLKVILVGLLSKREMVSVADVKDAWGLTRKHAIPLLERFDADGVTKRSDSNRTRGPNFPSQQR